MAPFAASLTLVAGIANSIADPADAWHSIAGGAVQSHASARFSIKYPTPLVLSPHLPDHPLNSLTAQSPTMTTAHPTPYRPTRRYGVPVAKIKPVVAASSYEIQYFLFTPGTWLAPVKPLQPLLRRPFNDESPAASVLQQCAVRGSSHSYIICTTMSATEVSARCTQSILQTVLVWCDIFGHVLVARPTSLDTEIIQV